MDLKNITSFDRFRRTYEAVDEFSNKTTFAESLLGRGFFSLIRFFKKGINLGRLEYLKRKLENEYFAGWLRFCALNGINLKDGSAPVKETPSGEEGDNTNHTEEVDQTDNSACGIFKMDWNHNIYVTTEEAVNPVEQNIPTQLKKFIQELEEAKQGINNDEEKIAEINKLIEEQKKIINYCDIKYKINKLFNSLWNMTLNLPDGMTFTPEQATPTIDYLERIKAFLNGDARICPSYHLTEDERKIINKINTCTNEDVKIKCNEILALLESVNYGTYDLINEEFVSSAINTKVPIMQILGDSLNIMPGNVSGFTSNTVQPYDYLKNIGINSVDEIDFKACADTWSKNPEFRKKTTSLVSVEGVKKIQYAASRIIYKHKSASTGHGEMSPGLDYALDSDLRTAWERKIEKCKGEWTYFMDVDYLDPFRLMSLEEAMRKTDVNSEKFKDSINADTKPIADTAMMGKIGLKLVTGTQAQDRFYIVQYIYGDGSETAYLLFSLMTSDENSGGRERSSFLYLGNINIEKIRIDKIDEKPETEKKVEVKKYAASILSSTYKDRGCTKFNDFFKINDCIIQQESGKSINSIVLSRADFTKINSIDTPSTNKTRLFFNYLLSGSEQTRRNKFGEISSTVTLASFKIKCFSGINLTNVNDPRRLKAYSTIDSKIGGVFVFISDEWGKSYFPDLDDLRTYTKNKMELKSKVFMHSNTNN